MGTRRKRLSVGHYVVCGWSESRAVGGREAGSVGCCYDTYMYTCTRASSQDVCMCTCALSVQPNYWPILCA